MLIAIAPQLLQKKISHCKDIVYWNENDMPKTHMIKISLYNNLLDKPWAIDIWFKGFSINYVILLLDGLHRGS